MGDSLKESLEAAYESSGSSDVVATPPVDESPPVVDEAVVDDSPAAEEPEAGGEPEGEPSSDESPVAAGQEEVGEEVNQEVPVAQGLKPPHGWKPAMREKFNALPEDVQREVIRREVDISKGMELAADARRFKQDFDTKVAPYQAELASRNVNAMDAFDNYLKTAYQLRHAPPQEKAALVGGLIQQYGIDVGMLDQILTNQVQAAQPGEGYNGAVPDPSVTAAIQQALQPYQQFMQSQQNQAIRTAEQTQGEVKTEVETFKEDPLNEFYEDVRPDMANLLEAAAMRNTQMTLQEAYDRAILLRPDLAEIVAQRRLQTQAQAKDQAAKAAQAKAVGVAGGSPDAGGNRAQPQSLRGAIEAAIDTTDM